MDKHAISCYIKAGEIAKEIKRYSKSIIRPGMKLYDLAVAIDKKIEELGAETAFPVNLSVDEIAAHFTPDKNCIDVARGLLKVDIGIAIDGYIADTAFSLDLTPNLMHEEMIKLNKEILENIEQVVKYGMEVRAVGNSAQDTLEQFNKQNNSKYSIIKGLSGHQLGQHIIHAGVTVSNYRTENKTILKDTAIAVEPFVTTGVGDIYEGEGGGIYAITGNDKPRDKDSRELLEYIKEKYKTRPFCLRWIEDKKFSKVRFCISSMVKQGIIRQYPLLIEKSKAPVSQFENTFLIKSDGVIITTKD